MNLLEMNSPLLGSRVPDGIAIPETGSGRYLEGLHRLGNWLQNL